MSRQAQMVKGLRRRTPWAGLDDETLDSCFGHGAAVVVRVASSGQRPEWRRAKDLERAQIAAFRHQALDHWKRVNAESRQADRDAVTFDPDRHASLDAPMDRLFEQPDLQTIARDLLAELEDGSLHRFWCSVLMEGASFKAAGDALGLTKAEVMARTRAGRAAFTSYLDRRDSGELCRQRGDDLSARRQGVADAAGLERAEAHLESCYACSLVHRPDVGAFERGILGMAPIGVLLRLASRAGEVAAVPATRWTEAGAGARAVAAGVAALTVAGSGVGVVAVTDAPAPKLARPQPRSLRAAEPPVPEAFQRPAALVIKARASAAPSSVQRRTSRTARKTTRGRQSARARADPSPAPVTAPSEPAASEFSFERTNAQPPPAVTPAPSPAPNEFSGP